MRSSQPLAPATRFSVLAAISGSHLLNDTIQSLLPAIYPILKTSLALTFAEVGLITFSLQATASLLQPGVGWLTDRRPMPYLLVLGMSSSLIGLLVLAAATNLTMLLVSAGLIGLGSSVFHPESSRIARMAAGGRYGLAQALFQAGGNIGSSCGPLLAALVVAPYGQSSIAWCASVALLAILLLWRIGRWHEQQPRRSTGHPAVAHTPRALPLPRRRVIALLGLLMALIFSKYLYLTSLTSFYTFYLISKFQISVQAAQFELFLFLAAVATGTILGGPLGDRVGRKWVIQGSIVGVLPFTLLLPHANLVWTRALAIVIGLILASAFSAILVYAQDLLPGRVGLVSGLFFGSAFGMAGVGAAALGQVADHAGIEFTYRVCAFLPAIGLLAGLLPNLQKEGTRPATPRTS